MARFCGNCGTRLDDSAKVCGNCGTPLGGTPSQISGVKVVNPEKKKATQKKIKKIITLCASVLAVVIVAVIVFNVISAFTGYNGLLRKVMTAYEEYDIDTLAALSSDVYIVEDNDDYAVSYFENAVGYGLDSFESSVGHSYKLSYETKEIYSLSKRNFESALKKIVWNYPNFDTAVIDDIVVAELVLTAKQGSKSVDRDLEITMTKENGDWKLLYIE